MMKLQGVESVKDYWALFSRKVRTAVIKETETVGRLIEYDAKMNVPVDTGKAQQATNYTPVRFGLGAEVACNVPYWAFIEFGTGGLVEVPTGWEELATPFIGTGKRTINRAAHPFLIPAWLKYRDQYTERIKRILNQ